MPSLHERVITLEHWRISTDIASARAEEQRKHLDQRFDSLDKKISKIDDTTTWAVRLVVGAIILAIVSFALRGGFNLPAH